MQGFAFVLIYVLIMFHLVPVEITDLPDMYGMGYINVRC